MPREKFHPDELVPKGHYPLMTSKTLEYMGAPPPRPEPRFALPITPRDNFRLAFAGKTPYWIPRAGWAFCDINVFRPRFHPDNWATRVIFDGEAFPEYTTTRITSSWFDLEWEFSFVAGGATVRPGNPMVRDVTRWEDYVSIPSLDDMDFEQSARENKGYLNTDKLNQLGILTGYWERLMSLMDVEGAAVAMIDEDEKKGVKRLFEQLTGLYIGYIEKMKQTHAIDCVLMHDDWGHQQAAFFSIDTCREMLVPYYRRVIDAVHALGMSFELHSCGKNQALVPAMIEAGVDLWCPQAMNDFDMLVQTYKDAPIIFGQIVCPPIPENADIALVRDLAARWVDRYKDFRVATAFKGAPPEFSAAVYEFSRIAFQDAQ